MPNPDQFQKEDLAVGDIVTVVAVLQNQHPIVPNAIFLTSIFQIQMMVVTTFVTIVGNYA